MPVELEHISQPTAEDLVDLKKIYADGPQDWLSYPDDIEASLSSWLGDGRWLIAGRFNSRLLAAMKADQQGQNVILSHFSVRDMTKGRGVAHQMLHFLAVWADEHGYTLIAVDVPESLHASLLNRGYDAVQDKFIRTSS